jgi:putative ABC transport system permease protein
MVQGQSFTADTITTANSVVVNQLAADLIDPVQPIGRTFTFMDETWTIVGVMDSFPIWSLQYEKYPLVLVYNPEKSGLAYVRIRAQEDGPAGVVAEIKAEWEKHFPDWPFNPEYLEELHASLYRGEDRLRTIMGATSFLAILLCCLGMYGLMSFLIQQRLKEISIRKILGADPWNLIRNLSHESLICLAAANVVAVPVAWYVARGWLQDYTFRIDLGMQYFVVGLLLSGLLAVIPVFPQLRRACRANPVEFLRTE